MANHAEPAKDNTATAWGSWEDLLLASAVHRHGFHDWDSVALEVQARSSLPHPFPTARTCQLKFRDLKRRFNSDRKDGVVSMERENGMDLGDQIDGFPWVDELRKLRVAELRRQVQRSDVSIHSLQLKVKRLEEEGNRSLVGKGKEISVGKPDPENSREDRSENDNKFAEKADRSEPDRTAVKVLVSGEESDGEDHSVNESNSTGFKRGDAKTREESETKPGLFYSDRSEPLQRDSKPVTADSDNGSSDTVAKNSAREMLEPSHEKKLQESSELDDSLARSTGGEDGARESSEVQSSASLAGKRKKRQRREIASCTIGDKSPLQATVAVEQLDEIVRIIQSHHHSWLFESRLESQESEEYKKMVRQHIDLENIRRKLHNGSYASLPLAFYRDLLLLFTNAVIFFPKSSDESIAAIELLHRVSSEMKKTRMFPTPHHSPDSLLPIPFQSLVPKLERSASVPIMVCRKRSSISAKPSSVASSGNKGEEYNNDEAKSSFDQGLTVKSTSILVEEPGLVREKAVTGARSLRRSYDGFSVDNAPSTKKQNTSVLKVGSVNKIENVRTDKKKLETVPLDKKRSAADFLKRIKQNSPAKTISNGGGSGGSREQKKGGMKGHKGRHTGEKKQAENENSPSKRSVGRPPKKVAETSGGSNKRMREVSVGKEPIKKSRKRSKR